MRLTGLVFGLVLISAVLSSCETMQAYEAERKKRRGELAAAKAGAAPVELKAPATVFQPYVEPPKVDTKAIAATKAVETAERQLVETDPSKTSAIATGPVLPELKTLITNPEDLRVVGKAYSAYTQAVANVRTSLYAFGLEQNLPGLAQVRQAGAWWELYLKTMVIRPESMDLGEQDIRAFYGILTVRGQGLKQDLEQINRYLDGQRTRVWQKSPSSP